jgi:Arc/MetJ family transcription regulator
MIDETLLDEALRLSGEKSYSAVVRLAVRDLVRRIKARRILSLRGTGLWEGRLEEMRGDDRSVEETR